MFLSREALLCRMEAAQVPLIAMTSPAGYGKKTVGRLLAARRKGGAVEIVAPLDPAQALAALCTALGGLAASGRSPRRVLKRFVAEDPELDADPALSALGAWEGCEGGLLFIDGAHRLTQAPEAIALLQRLAARAPAGAAVVLSATTPIAYVPHIGRPHEVLCVREEDLAFSEGEIAAVFGESQRAVHVAPVVKELTRGWPIGVLLLARIEREGWLDRALAEPRLLAREIAAYVREHTLTGIAAETLDAVLACAALGPTRPAAIANMLGAAPDSWSEAASLPPFVQLHGGYLELVPLIALVLRELYPERCALLRDRAGAAFVASGDLAGALRLFLDGDAPRTVTPAAFERSTMWCSDDLADCADLVARTAPSRLCAHPQVWASTLPLRQHVADPATLLCEAQTAAAAASFGATPPVRAVISSWTALLLSDLGRHDEALAELGEVRTAATADETLGELVRATVLSRTGQLEAAQNTWDRIAGIAPRGNAALACWLRLRVHAARVRGESLIEQHCADQSIDLAERSRNDVQRAHALADAAFGAWLGGDEQRCSNMLAKLSARVPSGAPDTFHAFARIASGQHAPERCREPAWHAIASLMRCTVMTQRKAAEEAANESLRAARESGDPFLVALACLALGHHAPLAQRALLDEARLVSERVDSAPFREAVDAVAKGEAARGMLAAFASRLIGSSEIPETTTLCVDVLNGTVRLGNQPLNLPERNAELLFTLAAHRGVLSRSRLCEMLWPSLDEDGAANALKMCVHRARTQLGDKRFISSTPDGYRLAPYVSVDLERVTSFVEEALRDPRTLAEDRFKLLHFHGLLSQQRPERMMRWEWFAPIDVRLRELGRRIGAALAEDALAHGRTPVALDVARVQLGVDACDEQFREIAIRAHLAAEDYGAAMREYEEYRDVLRRELDAEPSARLALMARAG